MKTPSYNSVNTTDGVILCHRLTTAYNIIKNHTFEAEAVVNEFWQNAKLTGSRRDLLDKS